MTELKFSTRIARFRCDNGKGEYDNEEFRSILKESGISFEPAPPYTEHKNGIAKRMIQTHNVKACAMMLDSQLPWSLWAEAINTANYLHARSPTSVNKGVTPYEKLYGSKPTISHLRRFGCKAYRMLPAAQRHGKFASCAETVYMLGYVHDSTSIWYLWNTERQRVIQASNVRFDELAITAKPVEHTISDPFKIAKLDTDRSWQVDVNATRLCDADGSRQVDADGSQQVDANAIWHCDADGSRQVDADGSWQVDANATRHCDADGSRQVDADTETSRQADTDSPRPTEPSSLAADELLSEHQKI